ncbi:MAG: cell wall anchor protein [Chloroflexales bacterium]|nr:cell wall anchor protein [Chloroflexales bacterium]
MCRLFCALALLIGLALHMQPASAYAQPAPSEQAVQAALTWLQSQQQPDGSFPGFSAGESADAIFALVAAGVDPNGVLKDGNSPVSFLGDQAASYAATSVGAAAKLTLAVVTAGKDPRTFGGVDLPALIETSYDPANGQYGADVFGHSLALLAISGLGTMPPSAAVNRLVELQLEDGGWSFDGTIETGSDTNTTSLAIQALAQAVSEGSPAAQRAVDYLKTQQNEDGGFPYAQAASFGSDTDANSTAYVLQALAALGQDPRGETWTKSGGNPQSALLSLQNDTGAFRYQAAVPEDNALATYQAIPGLLSRPLPLMVITLPDDAETTAPVELPAALPATSAVPHFEPFMLVMALLLLAFGVALRRMKLRA